MIAETLNPYNVIALCALGISMLTVIIMVFGQRKSADSDYVEQLEKRVERLEREAEAYERRIHDLEVQNGALMKENIELLRQLAHRNGAI